MDRSSVDRSSVDRSSVDRSSVDRSSVDRSSVDRSRRASADAASRTVWAGLEAAAGRLPEGEPARIARLTVRLRPGAGPEEVAAAFAKAMRARGPFTDRDAP